MNRQKTFTPLLIGIICSFLLTATLACAQKELTLVHTKSGRIESLQIERIIEVESSYGDIDCQVVSILDSGLYALSGGKYFVIEFKDIKAIFYCHKEHFGRCSKTSNNCIGPTLGTSAMMVLVFAVGHLYNQNWRSAIHSFIVAQGLYYSNVWYRNRNCYDLERKWKLALE